MSTSRFDVDGFGDVVVILNGDWSGEATVKWGRHVDMSGVVYDHEVALPAPLLQSLSRQASVDFVRDHLIGVLEEM